MANQNITPDPKIDSQPSLFKRLRQHHNAHWWALFISSLLLVCISMTWLIGIWQFKQVRVGDTKLTQLEVQSKLSETLENEVSNYQLTVVGMTKDNEPKSYKLSDMGLEIDVPASVAATKSDANYWRNRLLWWQTRKANIVIKTDDAKFINFVNKNTRVISKQVKNASLKVSPKGKVEVTKESVGHEKSLGDGRLVIYSAVRSLDDSTLNLKVREIQPSITTESIKTSKLKLEEIVGKSVKFSVESNVITPTAHDIASWLVITPNDASHAYNIAVDKTKLTDYINGQASMYIRRPINQVEVILPNKTKSILVTGQNGSDITNINQVIQSVQDELLTKKNIDQKLTVAYTPFKTVSTPAGKKLIEVDTTKKVMYAYENNVLLRTFYISAGAPATPTVLGTYSIYSKIQSQNMTGFNADGSTYFQPNVPYVNYFYRDYAIHGNYWRPTSYFGNVNSSHGCVGIQNYDAEWIYNWAPIGTPVVVHM